MQTNPERSSILPLETDVTMKLSGMIKCWVICLAALGLCLPQPLWAAVQSNQTPTVSDVALQKSVGGNALLGQVRDTEGMGKANVPVTLHGKGIDPVKSLTDQKGHFTFSNLRGGVYHVTAAGGVSAYRVWAPGTAPPAAQQAVLVVAGSDLVRGQFHPVGHSFGGLKFWLTHPLVIAGLVGTAVAVPILVYNDHDSKSD